MKKIKRFYLKHFFGVNSIIAATGFIASAFYTNSKYTFDVWDTSILAILFVYIGFIAFGSWIDGLLWMYDKLKEDLKNEEDG